MARLVAAARAAGAAERRGLRTAAQHPPGRAPSRTAAPWWSSRGPPQPPPAPPGRGGPAGEKASQCTAGWRVAAGPLPMEYTAVSVVSAQMMGSKHAVAGREQPPRLPPGAVPPAPPGRQPAGARRTDELPAGSEPERSSPRSWLPCTAWLLDSRKGGPAPPTGLALLKKTCSEQLHRCDNRCRRARGRCTPHSQPRAAAVLCCESPSAVGAPMVEVDRSYISLASDLKFHD